MSQEYPTNAGKILGGLIWNEMVDNFGTDKPNDEYEDIVQCFLNSKNSRIRSASENYKAMIAVRDGIKNYIDGYSKLHLKTTGTATPLPVCVIVPPQQLNMTEVEMSGHIVLNSDNFFNFYSLPNIFNIDTNDSDEDIDPSEKYLESLGKFFDIIVSWMSFPFVNINATGMDQGVFIKTTKCYISFESDKVEIFDKYKTALGELINLSQDYFNENQKPMPLISEKFWEILASGIVEYLNNNSIASFTNDFGFGPNAISGVDVTDSVTSCNVGYTGMSEGRAEFGEDQVVKISIEPPNIFPSLDINLNVDIELPKIECPTITIIDNYGVEKTINLCIVFGNISGSISEIIGNIIDKGKEFADKIISKLIKILKRIGESTTNIIDKINDVIDKINTNITNIITHIVDKINDFITEKVFNQILLPTYQEIVARSWSTALAAVPTNAFIKATLLLNGIRLLITKITDFIENIIETTKEIINKIKEIIQNIISLYKTNIQKIIDYIKNTFDIAEDFVGNVCIEIANTMNELESLFDGLSNITFPVSPVSPDIPDEPEEPIDDDGNSILIPPLPPTPGADIDEDNLLFVGIMEIVTPIVNRIFTPMRLEMPELDLISINTFMYLINEYS